MAHFSLWCVVLNCLVTLPIVFSESPKYSLTLYPGRSQPGVPEKEIAQIKVPYGNSLELLCETTVDASNSVFMYGSEKIDSQIVSENTRRWFVEKPPKQKKAYCCTDKVNWKDTYFQVIVDEAPSSAKDFHLLFNDKNKDEVNILWERPITYSPIEYSVKLLVDGQFVQPCEEVESVGDIFYCLWTNSRQPIYRPQAQYKFELTGCNDFGCKKEEYTIDHSQIIELQNYG